MLETLLDAVLLLMEQQQSSTVVSPPVVSECELQSVIPISRSAGVE